MTTTEKVVITIVGLVLLAFLTLVLADMTADVYKHWIMVLGKG
jgi:hypothetical protein